MWPNFRPHSTNERHLNMMSSVNGRIRFLNIGLTLWTRQSFSSARLLGSATSAIPKRFGQTATALIVQARKGATGYKGDS